MQFMFVIKHSLEDYPVGFCNHGENLNLLGSLGPHGYYMQMLRLESLWCDLRQLKSVSWMTFSMVFKNLNELLCIMSLSTIRFKAEDFEMGLLLKMLSPAKVISC